jgi:hypothetical protein
MSKVFDIRVQCRLQCFVTLPTDKHVFAYQKRKQYQRGTGVALSSTTPTNQRRLFVLALDELSLVRQQFVTREIDV